MQVTERERGIDGLTILSAVVLIAAIAFVGRDGVTRVIDRAISFLSPAAAVYVPAPLDGASLPGAAAGTDAARPVPDRQQELPAPGRSLPATPIQAHAGRGASVSAGTARAPSADAPITFQLGPGDDLEAARALARQRANASGQPVNIEAAGGAVYTISPEPKQPAILAAEASGRVEPLVTPRPAPQKPVADADGLYRVVAGDTLYDIARRHGATVEALMAVNHLRTTTIYSGQRLRIPDDIRQPVSPLTSIVPWYPTPAPRVYVEPNWAAAPAPAQVAEMRARVVEQVLDPSRLLSQGWTDPRCGVIMSCGGPATVH